jgi:hypothetical protein
MYVCRYVCMYIHVHVYVCILCMSECDVDKIAVQTNYSSLL